MTDVSPAEDTAAAAAPAPPAARKPAAKKPAPATTAKSAKKPARAPRQTKSAAAKATAEPELAAAVVQAVPVPAPAAAPEASPAPIVPLRRIRVVLARDGAALHVVEHGPADAAVTVVLAHGWTLTHGSWAVPARTLVTDPGASVRVVTYDQRGHGRSSSGLVRPYSIDQLGQDLFDVLEAVAPSGPVVLGGHSMGGMTIMALAAARPELFGARVRGVLLVGTSSGDLVPLAEPFPVAERLRARAGLRFFALGQRRPEVFARGRRILPGPHTKSHLRSVKLGLFGPDADESVVRSCAWMVHNTSVEALCGYFPAIAAHDKAGQLAALASVPVHIVVGDRDKLTPLQHSRRLAAELPHAELRIEPRCGHMVLTERPQSVTAPLRELCRVAAAGPSAVPAH
ncbi:alpha/beta fold hydrolase [Yinghuangia soli]|uniref:Alpha/beta hydrolase n=1 Tax=Yinghuangia soli TaxID=2908204 RepID=A0AA41PXN6_9ACTN|nr:alpha/beta hydrolase [Yinghuangia soli]MCF2527628.1 alpha/beta hydrolase [Yinghuangia soli]